MNEENVYTWRSDLWLDARRAAWLPEAKVLAVADLHLGYAWAERQRGRLLPLAPDSTLPRLLELQACYRPERIVCLGDNLHGRRGSAEELGALLEVVDGLSAGGSEVTLLVGNHDPRLDRMRGAGRVEFRAEVKMGPHRLIHGDGLSEGQARELLAQASGEGGCIIMGHEHPAMRLGDGLTTSLKCPCFLLAPQVAVLPAFSNWAAGTQVGRDRYLSALARVADFEVGLAILNGRILPLPLSKP